MTEVIGANQLDRVEDFGALVHFLVLSEYWANQQTNNQGAPFVAYSTKTIVRDHDVL